jgi:hypothetical protein
MKPDRELIALSKTKALEALADHFQLPHAAILTKARNLGFRSGAGRPWAPADDAQLLMLIASKTESVLIARKLKRTMAAIRKRKTVLKAKAND